MNDKYKECYQLFTLFNSIRRFSSATTLIDENVAAHTGSTVLYCLVFHKEAEEASGITLRLPELLHYMTVHDLDEVCAGDIPRPTKYSSPQMKEAVDNLGKKIQGQLIRIFGDALAPMDPTNFLTEDELIYTKCVDFLTVLFKVWWETRLGNRDAVALLPELKSYFAKLSVSPIGRYFIDNYMKPVEKQLYPTNGLDTELSRAALLGVD